MAKRESSRVKRGSNGQVIPSTRTRIIFTRACPQQHSAASSFPTGDIFDARALFEGVIPKPRVFSSGARDLP